MTNHKDIATPIRTKEILKKYGFSVKKSLGQNFIIDTNILSNIVEAAGLNKETNVVEVGPGIGALTEHLARASKEVIAFEIDDRLLPVLADTLSPYDNVSIIHQDVLQANLKEVLTEKVDLAEPLMVVANLPYYITTPIVMYFLESVVRIDALVIMMQKEVAERITAAPGSKAYGSLTIAVQYHMDAEIAFIVPKTVFMPQPNVDSAIIKLTRRTTPSVEVMDEKVFFELTRAAFVQRRKTLWNNLLGKYGKEEAMKEKLIQALDYAGIDPKRRGETLSLTEFGKLADGICLKVLN
ncbi:MAG: 16S rRNA (adenine(1518)-N(6)/adenine(1519)-N(6))-dimethyltransferase RsmA [Carnobacterium sp.]|uniref:Ribosomal RNA small subunit methyltransferase A n=1 Tax=Carnobacterium antarcticum TaxID=2126436 RepID=A0ABW4NK24_9LACT|nr:16S rRNA (adenine(1518)-N(6)/adenine(1519)-N(6))-dimethyltransferase RsmA [Carnobacterium sp. CP1]ALV22440.1 SSU rRNA (adenine-N/adenine-N)-dimethyltransferase [Carnobacterium sp. CP1]